MYRFSAALSGVLIALMVMFNAILASRVGLGPAVALIHLVGLLTVLFLFRTSGRRLSITRGLPWHYYPYGLIGIGLTLSNTLCFGTLGVTLTLALGLFGQSVFSLVIDAAGFFGRPRRSVLRHELFGIVIIATGLVLVLTNGGSR